MHIPTSFQCYVIKRPNLNVSHSQGMGQGNVLKLQECITAPVDSIKVIEGSLISNISYQTESLNLFQKIWIFGESDPHIL
jgi:hypothetical protein